MVPSAAWAGIDATAKLIASDAAAGAGLGGAVAVDAGAVVVGTNPPSSRSGSAYLFDADTGRELAELVPAGGPTTLDGFGRAVAVGGGVALVGAPLNGGVAYLFDAATGRQTGRLIGPGGDARFGGSVALGGGRALVGAYFAGAPGSNRAGQASLYDVATGQREATLFGGGVDNAWFGFSAALDGGVALVGAPHEGPRLRQAGAAYLYDAATGSEVARLAVDGLFGTQFGHAVALGGGVAVVGAPLADPAGRGSGAAYLFDAATGRRSFDLLPDDGAENDRFGWSVAVSGDTALVGAYGVDAGGSGRGAAYLFDTATGRQVAKLTAPDAADGDLFGYAVAASGTRLAVGALLDDDRGASSGSAYLFGADNLVATPRAGSSIAFSLRPSEDRTLAGVLRLSNDGDPGTSVSVESFTLSGPDAGLFGLPGFGR